MSNKEIKRKKLRYSSIIPKPNHSLTAYQLFNKTKYSEIKEDIPSSNLLSFLLSSSSSSYFLFFFSSFLFI